MEQNNVSFQNVKTGEPLSQKEIDEMWTLVYNQLDRAGEAVLTFDRELAQQVFRWWEPLS